MQLPVQGEDYEGFKKDKILFVEVPGGFSFMCHLAKKKIENKILTVVFRLNLKQYRNGWLRVWLIRPYEYNI